MKILKPKLNPRSSLTGDWRITIMKDGWSLLAVSGWNKWLLLHWRMFKNQTRATGGWKSLDGKHQWWLVAHSSAADGHFITLMESAFRNSSLMQRSITKQRLLKNYNLYNQRSKYAAKWPVGVSGWMPLQVTPFSPLTGARNIHVNLSALLVFRLFDYPQLLLKK